MSEPAARPTPEVPSPAAATAEFPRALPNSGRSRRRRSEGDDRDRPLLLLGALVQGLASVPPLLFFLSYFWNDAVHRRVYERGNGQVWQAVFWAAAPLAVALVPFLWTRRRWAYRVTLALCPAWAVGPLLYHLSGSAPKGSDSFLLFMAGAGALVATLVVSLLRKGRSALLPVQA